MSEKALANPYNLDGAFSSVTVKLLRGASEREVVMRLDALVRVNGDAGDVHPAALQMNEKQHIVDPSPLLAQ